MASDTNASEEVGVSLPIPRDNIIRAIRPGFELRTAEDGTRTLHGHFARFNEWTEIRSMSEGHFMERIAPGAFKKTFSENRQNMKVLFDHGQDPTVGNKPLGPIRTLEEDEEGARYEVDLLDTEYVRELVPALEAGLLGASFRFRVMREEREDDPRRISNDMGLPERTIREASVAEFGPVVFPAYAGATAGVRSLTDTIGFRRYAQHPDEFRREVEELQGYLNRFLPVAPEEDDGKHNAPTDESAEPQAHPVVVRRATSFLLDDPKEKDTSWI